MSSVWLSDTVPCLHSATLHVIFRILVRLSWCWFGCAFSQADWLLYNDGPSEGNSCWPHAHYLPSLCLRYSPSHYVHKEWINFQNTGLKYPYLKRGHTEFWIVHGRHGSRAWHLDIVLKLSVLPLKNIHLNTSYKKQQQKKTNKQAKNMSYMFSVSMLFHSSNLYKGHRGQMLWLSISCGKHKLWTSNIYFSTD